MGSAQSEIDRRLAALPGLRRRTDSRWAEGASYDLGEREIAHFHSDGSLDVRLTREVIRQLKAAQELDGRIRTRGPSADWVKLPIHGSAEIELAVQTVELAMRANA